MGYLHIDNLYKNQAILMFKECYALEKIHGTSAHIRWDGEKNKIIFSSGGESHKRFISLFDETFLEDKFKEIFGPFGVVIYGEAYGGKQQGMSATYGKKLKFIGFDVQIGGKWLNVPNAETLCGSFGIEFVAYAKVSTDMDILNSERDKQSIQAIRNGCGEEKPREGIVLRPIMELVTNNGERVISKHKNDAFKETKTPREVNPEEFKLMEDARAIAEEWVTDARLSHVLDKFPQGVGMESTKDVINAMVEDIYREAKGEIVENKNVTKYIGNHTARLFKHRLQNSLNK